MPTIHELADALAATPLGSQWADKRTRRGRLHERLAAHSDPLLREVGEQLRDGRIRPTDLLRHPHYRGLLAEAATRLAQLDPGTLRAEIDQYLAVHRQPERRSS